MSSRRTGRCASLLVLSLPLLLSVTVGGCRRSAEDGAGESALPAALSEDALRARLSEAPGRLAFVLRERLHVINPDGTGHRALVEGQRCADPSWTPDAARILYVRRVAAPGPERTEIWSVSSEGGEPRLEVKAEWYDAGAGEGQYWEYACPRASADGRMVYFAKSRGAVSDRQICAAPFGGDGGARRVARGFDFDVHPRTGQMVSVTFSNVKPWGYGIEVLYASDAEKRREVVPVAGDKYAGVAWSPDGSQVAATYWRDAKGPPCVVLIEAATGARSVRAGNAHSPTWSPDGKWLAWVEPRPNVPLRIVVATARGESPASPIISTPTGPADEAATEPDEPHAFGRQPAWSPMDSP